MRDIPLGERFAKDVTLTVDEIAAFARSCGDFNPLHHDEAYARQTRFRGIIACGPHITSLMMGMTATHFSHDGAMLGLEFTFQFRKAVKAGEPLHLAWEVIALEPKASLHGIVLSLQGTTTDAAGTVLVTGVGKLLATDHL